MFPDSRIQLSALRPRSVIPLLFVLIGLGPCFTSPEVLADGISITLGDELGPFESFDIGRSLFVSAANLPVEAWVLLELRDELDQSVARRLVQVDPEGLVVDVALWPRSGIIGCDVGTEADTYRFHRVETAIGELTARAFTVVILDSLGATLASKPLALGEPSRPIAFAADSSGCPRFVIADPEDLYLVVFGGDEGESIAVAVTSVMALKPEEVRSSRPEGESFPLNGDFPTLTLIWPGYETIPGNYFVHTFAEGGPIGALAGKDINSGLRVQDHSIPDDPE